MKRAINKPIESELAELLVNSFNYLLKLQQTEEVMVGGVQGIVSWRAKDVGDKFNGCAGQCGVYAMRDMRCTPTAICIVH